MTGSTKILTVSYGTFSCTLEGFDDPFGTMRGIAEYFRDLAADDRYFGAEPPTPDVEMLQRIAEKEVQRRVEARVGETAIALTQVAAEQAKPDEDAAPVVSDAPAGQPDERVKVEAGDQDHGPLTIDDDFLLADEPDDVLAVDPAASAPAEGPAETVAEKLRRIRAVVSRSIEPAQDENSFSEDQAPVAGDDISERRSRANTATIRQISSDLAEEEDYEDQDVSLDLEEKEELASDTRPSGEPVEAAKEVPAEDVDEEVAKAAEEIEDAGGWAFGDVPDGGADTTTAEVGVAAEEVADEDGWAFDSEQDEQPQIEIDETAGVVEETRAEAENDDDSVSATLSRVLARGAERKPDDTLGNEEPDEVQIAPVKPAAEKPASKPLAPLSEDGADVGRLMAETDHQMQDDEGIRRRRVISQMRAAVAATKADRLASRRVTSRDAEEAEEQGPYRHALSEAVREVSKPLPADGERRASAVPPLVLVSSQRVAAEDEKTSEVAEAKEAAAEDEAGGFSGFVESVGARELNELMEAAAAYASFVEGQSSFSRPEIMKRVARVDPALKLSREDGLRSFGQLLRQGTFRKLERGQFTIDESSRYRPNHRIAGE